jgi:O-6-methylguanine DNA methyltransferase
MRCRSALTRIDALRTGELPAEERGVLKDHLRTCSSCDESLEDVAVLAQAVKALAVQPPRSCKEACTHELSDQTDSVTVSGRTIHVAFSDRGLRMITLGGTDEEFREKYAHRFGRDLVEGHLPEELRRQLESAIAGEGVTKPLVDLDDVTDFERNVLGILTSIPKGEVRTYAWVASQAGRPKAVRAVGNICARNVVPFVVPCHRVVPTTGGVGNYAFGTPVKRDLLEREGVATEQLEELARRGVRFIGSRATGVFCYPGCRGAIKTPDASRVLLRNADEASEKGFRPCQRCQPLAA